MEKTINQAAPKVFIICLLFAATFVSLLYAQANDSIKVDSLKATISLKNGATLFSADSAFNKQISTNKILSEKADVSIQQNKGLSTVRMTTPKQKSKSPREKSIITRQLKDTINTNKK